MQANISLFRWVATIGKHVGSAQVAHFYEGFVLNDFAFVFVTPILGRDVDWKYLKILHLQVVLVLLPS